MTERLCSALSSIAVEVFQKQKPGGSGNLYYSCFAKFVYLLMQCTQRGDAFKWSLEITAKSTAIFNKEGNIAIMASNKVLASVQWGGDHSWDKDTMLKFENY